MCPDIVEMSLNFLQGRLFKVLCESRDEKEPRIELSTFVNDAHSLLIIADNFDEVTHYVRKESYSTKLNKHAEDPLLIIHRIEVAISHGT